MAGAAADGSFAGGQVPLRDAGADLDVCLQVSGGSAVLRGMSACRVSRRRATYSSICEICVRVSRVAGYAMQRRGSRVARAADGRCAYPLSHCAIHPAGSFGSVGSVGPESGDTGGWGGVGAAMLACERLSVTAGQGNPSRRVAWGTVRR